MPSFTPGLAVRHRVTQEDGIVKAIYLFRIGTNTGECLLVTVGKDEKIWLSDETFLINPTGEVVYPVKPE
jgi:hypothetical protein